MTKDIKTISGSQIDLSEYQPAHSVKDARQYALVSLISPILFMASLVSAAILVMSNLGQASGVFWFWLIAQCLICGALFLISLREKSILFDRDLIATESLVKRFSFVALGFAWGVVPGILSFIEPASSHLVFGAILSGLTMSATLLLRYMPSIGKFLIAVVAGGFVANTVFIPNLQSMTLSLIMLAYFSVLAICSRWYYARFSQRLQEAEEVAARAEELSSVLKDVGHAADTYFWRTDQKGILTELSDDALFANGCSTSNLGRSLADLFTPSQERDLLNSRIARQSEIVALELEIMATAQSASTWWKISARPVYEDTAFVGYRGAASEITQLRVSERRAAFLTEYDSLTGLLNRQCFYSAVQLQLNEAHDDRAETGILWLDLDNFKWINDTFGHAGGDEVLQLVAKRLQKSCQSDDVVCRFGGDEFAVLVTRVKQGDHLRRFVEQLTESLAVPYTLENSEVQCSASVGFKRIAPSEKDASALMKEADLALYSAKSSGRATWKEYSEAFKAKVRGQRELARDLEKSIGTDELKLQFQPIMDRTSQKVVAVEALSRWMHPTRGAISPAEFIPVAENNGLIIALGDSVVVKAIEAAARLPENLKVGINISPLQIHSSALLTLIADRLTATGVDPQRIELEITESVFLSDNAFVLERLRLLKDLGLRIALDDFGTGFSSLAYLQRFPFDKLKLDQAFVRGIETSDQSCAIARATISMAHALDLTVTAEGVETHAQADFLMEQGCDELQGFLYARPQDEDALTGFLEQTAAAYDKRPVRDATKIISLSKRTPG